MFLICIYPVCPSLLKCQQDHAKVLKPDPESLFEKLGGWGWQHGRSARLFNKERKKHMSWIKALKQQRTSQTITGWCKILHRVANVPLTLVSLSFQGHREVITIKVKDLFQGKFMSIIYLLAVTLQVVAEVKILGVLFTAEACASSSHVADRIDSTYRTYYTLYSGRLGHHSKLPTIKGYRWPSSCLATLVYGLDCMKMSRANRHQLKSLQGKLVKKSLGLEKRSHFRTV